MSAYDVFAALCIAGFILGIFGMIFGYIIITTIPIISTSFNTTYSSLKLVPIVQGPNQLSADLLGFGYFFPDLAFLGIVMLVAGAFVLSFFISSSPLSAVFAIALLVIFTICSFYIANTFIGLATLPVFASIVGSSSLLLELFLYLPYVLVICTGVDIAICWTSAKR